MTFEIPKINVKAQYRSSGVLILVQASGAGEYWGEYRKSIHFHSFAATERNAYSRKKLHWLIPNKI